MIMIREEIKGTCENCGFAHRGFISHDGVWPEVRCPGCGQETQNFDSSNVIDSMDKYDGVHIKYKKVEHYKTLAFA